MEIESIAAISMDKSASDAAELMEAAALKKAMALEQAMAAQLLQSLEAAVPTTSVAYGQRLDVKA